MKMRSTWRALVTCVVLAAALLATMGLGTALGIPGGDTPGTAFSVSSLPLAPPPATLDAATSDTRDIYAITLHEGETLDASILGPTGADFDLFLYKPGTASIDETADVPYSWSAGAGSNEHLTFMASDTGVYYLDVHAYSGAGTYTLDAHLIAPVSFSMSKLTIAKSAKKGRAVKTSVTVAPAYNGYYSPIEFYYYRYEAKKWKRKAIKVAGGQRNPGQASSVLSYSYKFPKKGKWRVRASFWDEAHPHEILTGYKYITIK
jgi:hypothetical protein